MKSSPKSGIFPEPFNLSLAMLKYPKKALMLLFLVWNQNEKLTQTKFVRNGTIISNVTKGTKLVREKNCSNWAENRVHKLCKIIALCLFVAFYCHKCPLALLYGFAQPLNARAAILWIRAGWSWLPMLSYWGLYPVWIRRHLTEVFVK